MLILRVSQLKFPIYYQYIFSMHAIDENILLIDDYSTEMTTTCLRKSHLLYNLSSTTLLDIHVGNEYEKDTCTQYQY